METTNQILNIIQLLFPNLNSNKFDIVYVDAGNGTKEPQLDYNGQPFTGFDVQDGIFWDDGAPYTLAALAKKPVLKYHKTLLMR